MMEEEYAGPTGDYPNGKLCEDDEGGLKILFKVSPDNKALILDFGTPVKWIGLDSKSARDVGMKLVKAADIMEQRPQ